MNDPKISIVLPAFNEEKYITDTLASLLNSNQHTELSYEVILVNNNSTDKTIDLAKKFEGKMNLKIINESKQGRGAARARGFMEAKGDIILSADADTIFYNSWVENLSTSIDGKHVAVTTSGKILDSNKLTNYIFNKIQPVTMCLYRIYFGHYWLSGFSFGILKSVYIKSGGFDTALQGQEDIDLGFKVAKLGKIKFINKPVVSSGRRFKRGLLYGLFAYAKNFSEIFILKKKNSILEDLR